MTTTIFFDLDGTLADLYGVEDWLDMLMASDALPYEIAKPLIRLSALARLLNNLQKRGVSHWDHQLAVKKFNPRI